MRGREDHEDEEASAEHDARVEQALDGIGLKYSIDPDGDFRFIFEFEDERSQMGFITSRTYSFAGLELREIFSAGLSSQGSFDPRTAEVLLMQNGDVKLGSWGVRSNDEGKRVAVFAAKVPADLAGDPLLKVIRAVLITADEMEKLHGVGDQF